MTKVLFVVTGFPDTKNPAGSVFNYRAAKYLSTNHDLTIIRLRTWTPGRKLLRKTKSNGFEYFEVSLLTHPTLQNKFVSINLYFINLVVKLLPPELSKADVIHSVGGSISAQFSWVLSRKIGIPLVVQYIGGDLNFYLTRNHGNSKIKTIVKTTQFHVFNSNSLRSVFKGLFPDVKNCEVIYRGVDQEEFTFTLNKYRVMHFLYLGGFVDDDKLQFVNDLKGGITLLKAWQLFLGKIPLDKQATLTICGPKSDSFDYSKILKQDELKTLRILGPLENSKIASEMQRSNVVVIPSRYEGLPNVVLEAMSSGNLVIASNVGGIPEIITHISSGMLVEPGDVDDLSKALLEAYYNPTSIERMALTAKDRVSKMSPVNFVKNYTSVYNKIVGIKTIRA